MAPPPEYDKEPKAPDKNFITTCSDDSKILYGVVKDQQQIPDQKDTSTTATTEAENNKDVETLDDGQLRALLDEAITYKCPKDREGKSSLFKVLLHEVEQDEQACAAACGAARGAGRARGGRGARARRELQSNSLQDLVAALAAEPAPRRARCQPPAQVSARAIHGGSLPSGVDTTFLTSEEPAAARGGYLATVRCVNPPPLAERRVSASDAPAPAPAPASDDPLARRSKPTFPMTYTARATLEIGSGSVCSGRAVTTTTASNQVRTTPVTAPRNPRRPRRDTPQRPDPPLDTRHAADPVKGQMKLMNAICSNKYEDKRNVDGGGIHEDVSRSDRGANDGVPRGQPTASDPKSTQRYRSSNEGTTAFRHDRMSQQWVNSVNNWYESLDGMKSLLNPFVLNQSKTPKIISKSGDGTSQAVIRDTKNDSSEHTVNDNVTDFPTAPSDEDKNFDQTYLKKDMIYSDDIDTDIILRKQYRDRVGYDLIPPHSLPASPTYFRKTTIGDASLVQSNEKCKKSTKISNKVTDSKNVTVYLNNQSTASQPAAVYSSYSTSLDSNNCKTKEKTNTNTSKDKKMLFENIALKSENPERIVKPIQDHSKYIPESHDREAAALSASSDYKYNDVLAIEDEENIRVYCKDVTRSLLSPMHNINSKIIPLETKNVELKKQGDASVLQDLRSKKELSCTQLKDINNFIVVEEISETAVANSSYPTDHARAGTSESGCGSNDTECKSELELIDIPSNKQNMDHSNDFLQHLAVQQKFLKSLENNYDDNTDDRVLYAGESNEDNNLLTNTRHEEGIDTGKTKITQESTIKELVPFKEIKNVERKENVKEKFIFAELPNNAYVFLTLPQSFFSHSYTDNNKVTTKEIEYNNNVTPYTSGENNNQSKKSKKKRKHKKNVAEKRVKNQNATNKNALKLLLYRNSEKSFATSGLSLNSNKEVDSAIPFTCITTPEVVASCNTTSSTSQSAVAADSKPLQLCSSYRAVSSLTGAWAPAAEPPPAAPAAQPDPAAPLQQPRGVISSCFNGLPLSRPNYGSTGITATDEYKKSLDENGNAVQGFSSPLSGSSQQKKPRRKKSTKNETVIKSHQIDGYQGNKDLNEVLRFIESNADGARGSKLGRAKHKDDADDKGKKRSATRKDKESKVKRASSLEERSRTTLEDLTERAARPPRVAPAKPERRSWGDGAREPFYLREPDAAELTDFQTVTKKRRARRRADDAAADPPRRARAPSPRRAPSDRSNDSNDDLDSVHSLPATRAPPAPHASYADIARTRHNIPDLIESCNFYAEGEARAAPPADADYPALAARRHKAGPRAAPRKDRAGPPAPPAPDVVADRRPPVVLLAAPVRARDLDGVTFGFDVNEQLLGAAPGGRCDLLRGTERGGERGAERGGERGTERGAERGAERGVRVAAGQGAGTLRYVPPPPPRLPHHLHHLHRIVDFVGAAWEDVVRCGGGKVRYYSE